MILIIRLSLLCSNTTLVRFIRQVLFPWQAVLTFPAVARQKDIPTDSADIAHLSASVGMSVVVNRFTFTLSIYSNS